MQVESNPKFATAANVSSEWVLIYAGNESQTYYNGLTNTTQYSRDVALQFYSFFSATEYNNEVATCSRAVDTVKYVLYAYVPLTSAGQYSLSAMSVYSERFYQNGTSD